MVLPTVVLDACVIFPMPLCDTLLRAAEANLYRLYFSQEILDEVTRNLIKKGKITEEAKAARYQANIKGAFPEAMVEVPAELVGMMTNHPKDRHVVAAAVKIKAEVIVTFNLKDFPSDALAPFGIEAKHPDVFLLDLCEEYSVNALAQVIQKQAEDLKSPPNTVQDLLKRLSRQVPEFAGKILCYKYGHDIIQIARRTLKNIGKKSQDGELIFQGNQYCLKKRKTTLIISDRIRGEILREERGRIEGNILVEDIQKFEEFSLSLDEQLKGL